MERNTNYYNNNTLLARPVSESVTIESPDVHSAQTRGSSGGHLSGDPSGHQNGLQSSHARRRWAASMHAMYLIRLFESFLYNPFYSLVMSLRMFGLIINIESQNHRIYSSKGNQIRVWIYKSLRYLLTTFMLIYILYYAIRTTLTVSYGGIWTNLKVLINAWITLWTVVMFLFKHNRISALMVHIQSVHGFVADHTPALKRNVMITIGGLWIYLFLSFVTFFYDSSYVKVEDLFVVNYGQWTVSKALASFIVYSDTILSVYFVTGNLIVIIITYLLLCYSLKCLFKDLRDFSTVQYKNKRQLTLMGLRELKNRHQLLALYSEELDQIFSFMVFLWFILVLVTLCIRVNTIIAGEYTSANIEGWMSSIWSIGITLLIYIGISLFASALNSESIDSALSIEKLAISHSMKAENNIYYELILFVSIINIKPIVLTCFRFFQIQRLLILIIAFIVITDYFFVVHFNIILINIQQKIVNNS